MKILVIQTTPTSWIHKLPTNKELNVKTFWDKWELLNKMCLKKHNRSLSDMIRNDSRLSVGYDSLNKELKKYDYNWNKVINNPRIRVLEIEL
ncbi:hypothetical protein [Erysipelothrix aquatica]|uniref:hypothetical protein n=1 Tax=Erysipelothrix aquatica TaxID=2683714 RepID=UPI00135AF973|nr:hypothetical protein [Erysipelothrix aquatica]